jgi:nitrogen-specific signal transduction histidine kinase/CheY-like chemotaxis protein
MFGTSQDVTEKKQTEARLVLADRLSAVGTMAAGVGHEINNPLAYVMANLDLIAEEVRTIGGGSPSGRLRDLLEMVNDARQGAERVRTIVRGLRTFARIEEERRVTLDVKHVLDLSINMTLNEIRHRARLVKDYGSVPPVDADEGRLGQVFINLLVNAAQSIPEGHVDRNEIRLTTRTDASGMAVIEVRDTGHGIRRDALGRIFDPFYTTKAIGEGTGLGLSICHGIVTALGGTIAVESEVGSGTVFRVALPAASPEPSIAEARRDSLRPGPGRRGRVLIVDDDETLAKVLRRALGTEHDVTTTAGAMEAMALLTSGPPFDVILCDLMMPEMTGMTFHAEVSQGLGDMADRMIFMSGGAFTPSARDFLDQVPNQRFEKPFDMQTLRAAIRGFLR